MRYHNSITANRINNEEQSSSAAVFTHLNELLRAAHRHKPKRMGHYLVFKGFNKSVSDKKSSKKVEKLRRTLAKISVVGMRDDWINVGRKKWILHDKEKEKQ